MFDGFYTVIKLKTEKLTKKPSSSSFLGPVSIKPRAPSSCGNLHDRTPTIRLSWTNTFFYPVLTPSCIMRKSPSVPWPLSDIRWMCGFTPVATITTRWKSIDRRFCNWNCSPTTATKHRRARSLLLQRWIAPKPVLATVFSELRSWLHPAGAPQMI